MCFCAFHCVLTTDADADADVPTKRTKYTSGDHVDDSTAMTASASGDSAVATAAQDDGEEAEF
jgi:hypothetical protein